jgi:hypothetical protein
MRQIINTCREKVEGSPVQTVDGKDKTFGIGYWCEIEKSSWACKSIELLKRFFKALWQAILATGCNENEVEKFMKESK